MTELIKPEKETKSYHVYTKVRDYLQQKYGYDERDYVGRYNRRTTHEYDPTKPHWDFWHWVVQHHDITNGCFITFTRDQLHEIQVDWVKEIYSRYLDEFADEDGTLEMWVWW